MKNQLNNISWMGGVGGVISIELWETEACSCLFCHNNVFLLFLPSKSFLTSYNKNKTKNIKQHRTNKQTTAKTNKWNTLIFNKSLEICHLWCTFCTTVYRHVKVFLLEKKITLQFHHLYSRFRESIHFSSYLIWKKKHFKSYEQNT